MTSSPPPPARLHLPRLATLAAFAVSCLFLWLAFRHQNLRDLAATFSDVHWGWLALAPVVYAVGHVFRGIRSLMILAPHRELSIGRAMNLVLIGYAANNVLPARMGELVRTGLLVRLEGLPIGTALSTVLVERVLDGLVIVAILFITVLVAADMPEWAWTAGLLGAAVFLVTALGLLVLRVFREKAIDRLTWLVRPLPERVGAALVAFAHRMVDGMAFLRFDSTFALIATCSLAVWVVEGGMMWVVMPGLGLSGDMVVAAYFALAVTNLAIVLPSSPGYVGTYHFFCQLSLTAFGVPEADALRYAIVTHLVHYVPVTLYGVAAAHAYGFGFGEVLEADGAGRRGEQVDEPALGAPSPAVALPQGGARPPKNSGAHQTG